MTLSKGQKTRQRLIEESVSTIARRGFEGVVLSEIAKAANVTRASIIQYFGSKENLIEETMRYLGQTGRASVLEFMASHSSIADPAERYVRANFAWAKNHHDEAVLLVYIIARAGYDKDSRGHVESIFGLARKTLAVWIQDGIKAKKYKVKDPQEAALSVHSTLLGFFILFPFASKIEVALLEGHCIQAIEKILGK